MIQFIARDRQPSPDSIVGKYVFGSLPLKEEYRNQDDPQERKFRGIVGVPTFVTKADAVFFAGHPVKLHADENGDYDGATVVADETHRREIDAIRIVCDTKDEVLSLIATRTKIDKILTTHEGRLPTDVIKGMIDEVYSEVARNVTPQLSAREAMMNRVSARLQAQAEAADMPADDISHVAAARPASHGMFR